MSMNKLLTTFLVIGLMVGSGAALQDSDDDGVYEPDSEGVYFDTSTDTTWTDIAGGGGNGVTFGDSSVTISEGASFPSVPFTDSSEYMITGTVTSDSTGELELEDGTQVIDEGITAGDEFSVHYSPGEDPHEIVFTAYSGEVEVDNVKLESFDVFDDAEVDQVTTDGTVKGTVYSDIDNAQEVRVGSPEFGDAELMYVSEVDQLDDGTHEYEFEGSLDSDGSISGGDDVFVEFIEIKDGQEEFQSSTGEYFVVETTTTTTSSPTSTPEIDNFIPGQVADFTLSVEEQGVYADEYYQDGDIREFYYKDVVVKDGDLSNASTSEDVEILDSSNWTQIDFPDSNGTDEVDLSQSVDFNIQRYEDADYSAAVSLAKVEGVKDFNTGEWNQTATELDRTTYSWTVTAADSPVGPLQALENFFSGILESIIDAFDTEISDSPIGTPSVENPPSGP